MLTFAVPARSEHALVVCYGTLTSGHLGTEGPDAVLGLAQPGGHVVFSVRRNRSLRERFPDRVLHEQRQGTAGVVSSPENAPRTGEEDAGCWTLRKVASA